MIVIAMVVVVLVMMAMVIVMMVMGRCARGESQNPLQGSVLQSSPAELGGLRCRGHSGAQPGRRASRRPGRRPKLRSSASSRSAPLLLRGAIGHGAKRCYLPCALEPVVVVVREVVVGHWALANAPALDLHGLQGFRGRQPQISLACRARHASYPELV